jgi:type I restriction enzyme M protein
VFGVPPESYADLAFVEHMVASIHEITGRLAVVMPHGALFRGAVEQRIRRCLIEANLIEAVVGLPSNLFYNTTIPAAILICRAPKSRMTDDILFIDASARFLKGRNQNEMTDEDIAAVLRVYAQGGEADPSTRVHSQMVPVESVAANDWDLNIGRYVEVEAEAELAVATALEAYREARDASREAEARFDERLAKAGLVV